MSGSPAGWKTCPALRPLTSDLWLLLPPELAVDDALEVGGVEVVGLLLQGVGGELVGPLPVALGDGGATKIDDGAVG